MQYIKWKLKHSNGFNKGSFKAVILGMRNHYYIKL